MRRVLRAEFRKLLTVRSTYFVTLLIIVLSCLFTYLGTSAEYVDSGPNSGQRATSSHPPSSSRAPVKTKNLRPDKLASNILEAAGAATFIAVVTVLLMAHEFRYNTINYTLTSSNSRSKVLLAKVIASSTYTVIATIIAVLLTIAFTYLAIHIKGLYLPPQEISWVAIIGRLLGFIMGYSLLGLAFITLLRNLTAAIVALFLLPTVDALVSALLTRNDTEPSRYLPFSALNRLVLNSDSGIAPHSLPTVTQSLVVFLAYLIGLWAITWYLFLHRDAA